MALIRWEPFREIDSLQREMNRYPNLKLKRLKWLKSTSVNLLWT